MPRHKTLIWAHRGASGYAPENTMEAFILAHQYGADGIELDVQMSADGELVVIHDEKINRTSDGKGDVKDFTFKQLRQFRYNRTKPQHARADIPTLREVLTYVHDRTDMTVDIEIKNSVYFYDGIEEKTMRMVRELGMEKRVNYSSFNHYAIRKIRELDPDTEVGLLFEDGMIDMPGYGHGLHVNSLNPRWNLLQYPDFLEDCRRYGLELNVWTVNDEPMMRRMFELGVHAIITNYPDRAVRVREQFENEQSAGVSPAGGPVSI